MNLCFRNIEPYDRGLLATLLAETYRRLEILNEPPWVPDKSDWQKYDDEIFDELEEEPEDEVFLTLIDGEPAGFASYHWQMDTATVGRNCVLPKHGGRGIGLAQVDEILSRVDGKGIKHMVVVTGTHPFFEPARRMYLSAGFDEQEAFDDGTGTGRSLIRYRLDLTKGVRDDT